MPEGDTVWLAGRRLDRALAGGVLLRSDFRVPALATVDLSGRAVLSVHSRGKHLLTRVEGGVSIHSHFRMDGSWHLYRPGHRWQGGPTHQVRAVLETAQWQAVGYRLPVLDLLPTAEELRVVGHLGPDLLGVDWDAAEALRRLRSTPDGEVGQALLDQRNLAGIGNLYKVESLFLEHVSPWTRTGDVPDLEGLVERARTLLQSNKDHPEQSTTGDLSRGRQHWVFERSGRPCRRCGSRILQAEQGPRGQERLTYWCPRCQPGPAPAPLHRQQLRSSPTTRARYRR